MVVECQFDLEGTAALEHPSVRDTMLNLQETFGTYSVSSFWVSVGPIKRIRSSVLVK